MSTRKQNRNQEPPSNTGPMVVLIGGGLAVAALVGWAVMRSMQAPATTQIAPEPAPIAQTTSAPPVTSTFTPPPPQPQNDETAAVPRTEVAQLRQQIASNAVTVIDVRDMDSYIREHIPGALHIPMTRIQGELGFIPKDKPIVTYCT